VERKDLNTPDRGSPPVVVRCDINWVSPKHPKSPKPKEKRKRPIMQPSNGTDPPRVKTEQGAAKKKKEPDP